MPLKGFSWSIARSDGVAAQGQLEGGHVGMLGTVGDSGG